ncbi:unnamed protein product [Absidia cylindrospora]
MTEVDLVNEKIEVTSFGAKLQASQEKQGWTTESQNSSDLESINTDDSYDPSLEWTPEEENKIRTKLDIRLMSFVLLMTFVLNMDRTNICKCCM